MSYSRQLVRFSDSSYMELHKDKERLRHQKQIKLLNKVMNIIPKCPFVSQTRVRKLRHLVLYYHFMKMIHARTTESHSKMIHGNQIIFPKKKAKPICKPPPKITFETKEKRQRANIVFLQVDRSDTKKPDTDKKRVLTDDDYETFYNLEKSPLTINLGYEVPEVEVVNNVFLNQASFPTESSSSPVNANDSASHKNESSFMSNLVNQNGKSNSGFEPIMYSDDDFSDDKENLSPAIENNINVSSNGKMVEDSFADVVDKMPQTCNVLVNDENSLLNKHGSRIPSNTFLANSKDSALKDITNQDYNTCLSSSGQSETKTGERNTNNFETYPGQKVLEEYVSNITFRNCQNIKDFYDCESSSCLKERNTDLSESYSIQNSLEDVSNISSKSSQNKIDLSHFQNISSPLFNTELYMASCSESNSENSGSYLSTDELKTDVINRISESSNPSYTDFADNATSFSDDGNLLSKPVYPAYDNNYISVPDFAGTPLACYGETGNSCFLPVYSNYSYFGNDALQNDFAFGNESLPYFKNINPFESPAVVHPLGFYNLNSNNIARSDCINEDASLYDSFSIPSPVVENLPSEEFPLIQPKQEVNDSSYNCLSAVPETNESSFYNEENSHSLFQYINNY